MMSSYMLPGTLTGNIDMVCPETKQLYTDLKVSERLPRFTKGMFHPTKNFKLPCLIGRGSCIKAFAPIREIIFERHINDSIIAVETLEKVFLRRAYVEQDAQVE